ncbi:sensor histidine kinase [Spirosoma radiotolerans]|nr:PAS domain S-box protein [Spirosoma radiotolerans]
MTTSTPEKESVRLHALTSYNILDTLPEQEYDAITQIASHICQTPISLISLLDDHRQWFKSAHGLAMSQTPRQDAFCSHAINEPDQLMVVTDARIDKRFITNPLVTGEPNIVFYAGMPLVDGEGQALGTLCVFDRKPRQLDAQQQASLEALARQVVSLLQLRRSQSQLAEVSQTLQTLNQELHRSNQTLQTIVDNCPAGLVLWKAVWKKDRIIDFQYVFTNSKNATFTGLPIEQMTGNSLKSLFPEVAKDGLFKRLLTVIETRQQQQYQQSYDFNQRTAWGEFTLTPCGDGILFSFQDITQLKKTEQELKIHTDNLTQLVSERTTEIYQLSALQKAILEHAGVAIISTDTEGLIQTVNPAAEKLVGYRADELIGQHTPIMFYDPIDLDNKAKKLTEQLGQPVKPTFELFKLLADSQADNYTICSRDGRRTPVVLTRTALRDESGTITGYVGMATDITTQKQIELLLQQSLEREQELNKLKSKFVTTASHEFRTPLATIQSSVELVKLYLEQPREAAQPVIQRHLASIENQILNVSDMLSDMLNVAKIEAGKIDYNPQLIEIDQLIHDVIRTHFTERQDKRTVLVTVNGQPQLTYLDKKLMTHVLGNLLSNAFKFSTENPELHVDFEQKQLVLTVVDKGIGIPASELPQLFNTFFRASNAVTIQGSGLGLVIARQFVELHGGSLTIGSEENQGTHCTIKIPYQSYSC